MSKLPALTSVDASEADFQVTGTHFFPELCEVQIRSSTNSFDHGFDLNIDATFNETVQTVEIADTGMISSLRGRVPSRHVFRIRLRHCRRTYRLDGCGIPIATKYFSFAQDGTVKSELKIRSEAKMSHGARASAKIRGVLGLTGANLSASADLQGTVDRQNSSHAAGNSVTKPTIPIVNHVPNGWQFGDNVRGDPRYVEDGSCLKGTYSLYGTQDFARSCQVEFRAPENARLTFEMSARGGLFVERDRLGSKGSASESEEQRVREHMRSLVAGMLVEKLSAPDGSDGTVLIARHSVRVKRSVGREDASLSLPAPTQNEAATKPSPARIRAARPRKRASQADV